MPEIFNFLKDKNVLVIGWPASGKTFLSAILKKNLPEHSVIHTDDYLEKDTGEIINVIKAKGKTIVEGVCGYRVLRRGAITSTYHPDVVIEMTIEEPTLLYAYSKLRDSTKISGVKTLVAGCKTILADYERLNVMKPYWIKLKNDYGNL